MSRSVVVLALFVGSGCGSEADRACDAEALAAATRPEEVRSACQGLPEPVATVVGGEVAAVGDDLWPCEVPLAEAMGSVDARRKVVETCGLPSMLGADPLAFAWSGGNPAGAVVLHHWLTSNGAGAQRADAAAAALMGPFPGAEASLSAGAFVVGDVPITELFDGNINSFDDPGDPDPRAIPSVVDALPPGVETVRVVAEPAVAANVLHVVVAAARQRGAAALTLSVHGAAPVTVSLAPPRPLDTLRVDVHAAGITASRGIERLATVDGVGALSSLFGEATHALVVVHDDQPVRRVPEVVTALAARGLEVALDTPPYAPCFGGGREVACIPMMGSKRGDGQLLAVGTFVLDAHEATVGAVRRCVEAGACPRTEVQGAPDDPATLSWEQGVRYCAFEGKRLPTEWEWEKAARGPGGREARGLPDILTGHAEWTVSAGVSLDACGEHCVGLEPRGICQGAEPCEASTTRVVRGKAGEPVDWRRLADPSEPHAVRCAADGPRPFSHPAAVLSRPRAVRALPQPPDAALLAAFNGVQEDPIDDKPLCEGVGGQAQLDCRDPASYVVGNEPRSHLFAPYIANLGGGYVGVAADQNYSQVAVARSEWAWFMDYDPKVVSVHKLNKVVILDSPTAEDFVAAFSPANRKKTHDMVESAMAGDPDASESLRTLRVWGDRLYEHYRAGHGPPAPSVGIDGKPVPPGASDFGWLRVPEHYAYIRTLFQEGRARAVKGDMLGQVTMSEIGRAAREMGVPIRVYYTSNAPFAWGGTMTPAYRENVRGLPMDHASVVIQTLGSRTGFGQQSYWHYNVASGLMVQERLGLPGFDHVSKLVIDRVYAGDPDLTTLGIPGR